MRNGQADLLSHIFELGQRSFSGSCLRRGKDREQQTQRQEDAHDEGLRDYSPEKTVHKSFASLRMTASTYRGFGITTSRRGLARVAGRGLCLARAILR